MKRVRNALDILVRIRRNGGNHQRSNQGVNAYYGANGVQLANGMGNQFAMQPPMFSTTDARTAKGSITRTAIRFSRTTSTKWRTGWLWSGKSIGKSCDTRKCGAISA
eukprot:336238_1